MSQVIPIHRAKFSVGQLIHHRLFGYRGVIFDVDSNFQLSDEWYEAVARSRPPKDQPWYHVLVDGTDNTTYVAERNLEADSDGGPVQHPLVNAYFTRFESGRYQCERQ
ncbi:MAG: heat shock protein HspQ [Acidiferrobacteraceae bacterium]|jgi:heat shock protein HspQ